MNDEIRNLGKNFSEAELLPHWEVLDRDDPVLLGGILKKAAANGVFSFLIAEKLGGSGLCVADYCVFIEEVSRGSAAAAAAFAAHLNGIAPMLLLSDNTIAADFLSEIASSDANSEPSLFAPVFYEENAGELFPRDVNTTFALRGDSLILSGSKSNVPCAAAASFFTVLAKSEAAGGNSIIVIPSKTPGVEVAQAGDRLGLRFCPSNGVTFNKVEIHPANIILDNADEAFLRNCLEYIDPVFAAVSIGVAAEARAAAIKYSLDRYQGGKMICDHDSVRSLLTGMEILLRASRSFAYGPDAGFLSSAFAAEAAEQICLEAIQILGGYGYMRDYKIERMLRDVKTIRSAAMSRARGMEYVRDEISNMK